MNGIEIKENLEQYIEALQNNDKAQINYVYQHIEAIGKAFLFI